MGNMQWGKSQAITIRIWRIPLYPLKITMGVVSEQTIGSDENFTLRLNQMAPCSFGQSFRLWYC